MKIHVVTGELRWSLIDNVNQEIKKKDFCFSPKEWKHRLQLICRVVMHKVCFRSQTSCLLIWMKLNTYIILTSISQQTVNFGNGKEVKAIYFIFVFFCLRVQLLSYKEFMFSIQQMLISHLTDIAKVLQKMTFRNNKLNSYHLSDCLSDKPNSLFQKSRKGCRDSTKAVINSQTQSEQFSMKRC